MGYLHIIVLSLYTAVFVIFLVVLFRMSLIFPLKWFLEI